MVFASRTGMTHVQICIWRWIIERRMCTGSPWQEGSVLEKSGAVRTAALDAMAGDCGGCAGVDRHLCHPELRDRRGPVAVLEHRDAVGLGNCAGLADWRHRRLGRAAAIAQIYPSGW